MKSTIKLSGKLNSQVLYAICRLAWTHYSTFIASFTAFNAMYNSDVATNALAAVEAASALPDVSARRATTRSMRHKLSAAAENCTANFQVLLRYIEKTFPYAQVEPMKALAGMAYYAKARAYNWKQVTSLITTAAAFIAANRDTLLNNGQGMPDGFEKEFDVAKSTFEKMYKAYNDAKQAAMNETAAKTAANNAVYTTLMDMLKDVKTIFARDADTRKMFTLSALKKIVSRSVSTGLRIAVKDSATGLPVTTTTFVFQPDDIAAYTDSNGVAIATLKGGITYSYTATTPGYATAYGNDITTTTGIRHRISIMLNKQMAVA